MKMVGKLLSLAGAVWMLALAPESASPQSPEAASKVARPIKDYKPKPPGPAFLMDLTRGFDPNTHYISDYAIKDSWINSSVHPRNVIYGKDGVTLRLEKRRDRRKQYTGAEIQRQGFYGYGRFEAVMKPAAGNGVVTSYFTHTFEMFNDPHDEVDIEFLGNKPTQLHLNYFKDSKQAGSIYVQLDFDWSKDFHLYAYEWDPNEIRWYVDGKLVHRVTGPIPPIPLAPGRVMVQLWAPSAASVDWVGKINLKRPVETRITCLSHVPRGGSGPQCSDQFKASPPK
jgi:endo-1,3-1,4-beta-glycanase ExoK